MDDIDLLAEISDDPDDEDSDYGRGWQDGFRAGQAATPDPPLMMWRDGEVTPVTAATPDGPRSWALPAEPGPEVTALQDRLGRTWSRMRGLPLWGGHGTGSVLPFIDLLDQYGPLTDATPAADGQDGDGHG